MYKTGDLKNRPEAMRQSATEGTPLLVEDSLVFCTPFNEVIAVHPGTGEEMWRFDPQINLKQDPANQYVCRGRGPLAGPVTGNGATAPAVS